MDFTHMVSELRSELHQLEEAILALQRLAVGQGKRRGRPPKWMASANSAASPDDGHRKRTFSLATRKKMARAQRRRWAAKSKAKTA
jgi:hypothetical protein